MITESILTCPQCQHKESEKLLENISPIKFNCKSCQQEIRIEAGECCIYCQYGDYPCFQAQIVGSACCAG